jgi:hypothetical protein
MRSKRGVVIKVFDWEIRLFDEEYKQRSWKIHNRNGQTSAMNRENITKIVVNHLLIVRICGWSKSLMVEIELLIVWLNEEILFDRSGILILIY